MARHADRRHEPRNDSPKAMGIIMMALLAERHLQAFVAPLWVRVAPVRAIALGAAIGGQQLICIDKQAHLFYNKNRHGGFEREAFPAQPGC